MADLNTCWCGWRIRSAFCGLLVLCLVIGGSPVWAAEPTDAERQAVRIAILALEDGQYESAEQQFTEFAARFPESALLSEAFLGQAEARYRRGNFEGALALLREQLPRAGVLSDQFEYWIGESLIGKGELEQAEAAFGGLITRHPQSTNILAASVRQAFTVYQRKDYERTVALLADPAGAFEQARVREPASPHAINGLLFLAESRFELKRFAEVEATLALLPATTPWARPAWRRAALLTRVYLATNRAAEAQGLINEVLAQARATEDPELMAESHALNGAVLEQLGRKPEALVAYEPNLAAEVPRTWRAQALVRVVTLAQETGGPDAALQKLELLSEQGLDGPARDLVRLTVGELRLAKYYALPANERPPGAALPPAAAEHLTKAREHFNQVIAGYTNSPLLGKAWLNRGWCHWEQQEWPAAAEAFGEASRRLPAGEELAVAVFKLGDVQFQLGQFEAALTNFSRVAREFAELPRVKEGLLDQAYYQMIKAAIQTGNQAEAEFAVAALMAQFPGNFHAERGLLLVGQFLNDIRLPAKSRAVLEEFASRFPGSTLAPERDLAIARTFELEEKWSEAASIYQRWLGSHANHPSRAQAEFGRAFALYRTADSTNALAGFTHFVAQFPKDPLTPKALLWLGMHYEQGRDYVQAEVHYQQIFSKSALTNWPVSRETYQARIDASRSALLRQSFRDARGYLADLFDNWQSCPPERGEGVSADCCPRDIYARALFAYGDVYASDSASPQRFDDARKVFQKLVDDHPESPLVPAAWGRIGDCSVQLERFEEATNAYTRSIQHPAASVTERSRARVGLGQALEKLAATRPAAEQEALFGAAREHYLDVFYFERKLDTEAGEVPDPEWMQQACFHAAQLAARRKDWNAAVRLYQRLAEYLPVLKDYTDARIRDLHERARAGG